MILGMVILAIGLVMGHCSLQVFKNRIEDSNNLLKIIPKHIRQKNKEEIIANN